MGSRLFLASVCALVLPPAYGQLYLIQGSPTPQFNERYQTNLLQVSQDGSVRGMSGILPGDGLAGGTGGTEWIGLSYDHRKAVFVPKAPSRSIVVLDLDTASVTKTCASPPAPAGMSDFPFEQWFTDLPGKGLMYVEHYATADGGKLERGRTGPGDDIIRGMVADPSVACAASFVAIDPGDMKFLAATGQAGIAGLGSRSGMDVGLDKDGSIWHAFLGGERAYFGYRIPEGVMSDVSRPIATVVLNDREALAVVAADPSKGRWHLPVLRKSDGTWHAGPEPGPAFVRGFGSFLALTETGPRTPQNPESAGAAEWRKAGTAAGPSIDAWVRNFRDVLPGKLDLYSVTTDRTYSITTNQGDSEVLLVDNNTVYYRVSDRLYSAAIGKDGLEPANLLATSESIRDVHWAFVKH